MAALQFSTKAGTLAAISEAITSAKVLPLLRFQSTVLEENSSSFTAEVHTAFAGQKVIIRSSAANEDGSAFSQAGHFRSVPDVPADDEVLLLQAAKQVVDSYESKQRQEEFFVQPMLQKVRMCGVAFTTDLATLAPYYIFNYDEQGRPDAVTGGRTNNLKTFVHFKQAPFVPSDPNLAALIVACRELESLFENPALDIEFAFSEADLFILQVRPIVTKCRRAPTFALSEPLSRIHRKIEALSCTHPNLYGSKTIFGVMPDWNPAEIIGLKPKRLALSLYKELVTDSVWAYQRNNYGYRNLRSHPLLISFLGVPFIDVRVDFNSFIPDSLNETIAGKLIEYYLHKLNSMPQLHDKVEFEIVHSCFYLNLPARLHELLQAGFNENELKRIEFALLDLTNNVINPKTGLYSADVEKSRILAQKHRLIVGSHLPISDKIYWLVEYIKRYGTLPFAGIARAAFIAVQILKSFVATGIMTSDQLSSFLNSLNTVAKRLNNAICELSAGMRTKEDFLHEFGHLRPGTYDIMSLRYDENFENYFSLSHCKPSTSERFEFTRDQLLRINQALMENGIQADATSLLTFITEAIEGREYSKFLFTHSLSEVLRLIEQLGGQCGVSRSELAHLNINTVLSLYGELDHRTIKEVLERDIAENKELYQLTEALKLPSLIYDPSQVYSFFLEAEEPNFVTLKSVTASALCERELQNGNATGKIVLIKSADPGYDFLFTKNIAGLITQFGGANSHMAIRCAELGVPAVIGSGAKNFEDWERAAVLEIDALNKQVRVIS